MNKSSTNMKTIDLKRWKIDYETDIAPALMNAYLFLQALITHTYPYDNTFENECFYCFSVPFFFKINLFNPIHKFFTPSSNIL